MGATPQPVYCRKKAFELFAEQAPKLEEPGSLLLAAVAIAMHEMESVQPNDVIERIDDIAQRIRSRVQVASARALLAHAHDVLFEEENFVGNVEDYYNPRNSYVPAVLETHHGIPIALALIYKEVLERLDIKVFGLNTPGHFLAEVELTGETMLVDVFCGGRSLTQVEARERVRDVLGAHAPVPDQLEHATGQRWIRRMLGNLQIIFQQAHDNRNLGAMLELQKVLETKTRDS